MYHRTWTLIADLSPAALQLMAAEELGYQPGVTDGAWSSVNGLGDDDRPPEWMQRLSDQLKRDGIEHQIY